MAKVLLVEDDNNLREIYEARLQAEGYEIVSASDGEQALAVAKDAKPDLVISDVMMPKISGFEMLDILRNTDGMKDVKVIMLTALGQAEDKARADQLGADSYLVKSQVTLEDIVKTAHQLLNDEPEPEPAPEPAPVTTVVTTPVTEEVTTPPPVPAAAPVTAPAPVAPPMDEPVAAPTPAPTPAADIADDLPAPVTVAEPPTPAVPEPVVPADQPSAAATTSDDDTAATEAEEKAAMAAEITNFEKQEVVAPVEVVPGPTVQDTPAAPTPPTPAASSEVPQPAPLSTTQAEAVAPETVVILAPATPTDTTEAANDKTMAEAVDSLADNSQQRPSGVTATEVAPEVAPDSETTATAPEITTHAPAVAPADTPPTETVGDGTSVGHKKVISPISDPATAKPDINTLLAAEEAREQIASVELPPAPAMPPVAPPASAEPAGTSEAPTPADIPVTSEPTTPSNGVDPSSIAL